MVKENILLHKLCCDISKYESFVLYGAGYVAEAILECLEEQKYMPQYCIVTQSKNDINKIRNIDIFSFNEKKLELEEKNILILVAVSELYENEIVKFLKDNNISNFIITSQYVEDIISEKNFKNIYQDKDYKWYKSKIQKWYFDKNGITLNEEFFEDNSKIEERIVFVVESLSPRVIKIKKSLEKNGKEVIVLMNKDIQGEPWDKYISALNSDYEFYGTIEELFMLIKKYSGRVIHMFMDSSRLYVSYFIIKNQEYLGKAVFETCDIYSGFYVSASEYEIELEKYCLENALAICYREYSLEYLTKVMNYDIKGKALRFYDYCSENQMDTRIKTEDNELSLCYAGSVITEEDYEDCPFGAFLEFANICKKNKCHFHVYPFHWDEKHYRVYIEEAKKNLYFHFHMPISYDKLSEELSQYDYGICLTRDDVWEKEISGYNTKYKYIYAGTNKYFDYLDAGLPIITATPQKFIQDLEREGVLINWTIGQYDFEYLKEIKEQIRAHVKDVRDKFKIDRNITQLLEFYDSL